MGDKFSLGTVVAGNGVQAALTEDQIRDLVTRHVTGDWGQVRQFANMRAIRQRDRIFSEFFVNGKDGQPLRVWLVTEANRARTMVMVPAESPYLASDLEEDPGPFLCETL